MNQTDLECRLRGSPGDIGAELAGLRVAIVHYWLVAQRGGERVIQVLADMFPQADIFTLVVDRTTLPAALRSHKITSSFLQKIPGATKHYQKLLPLFPLALESFRLDEYDLVISSESGPAKGVLTSQHTCHICYCHTPMRYLWDMYHEYRLGAPGGKVGGALYAMAAHYVRLWDYAASARVDHFACSSLNAAARIRKYYRRHAKLIYPPVDICSFTVSAKQDEFYLVVSPLVSYKRIDLAIAACNTLKRRLVIIGQGAQLDALRRLANSNITFLGFQSDEVVHDYYSRCRALLFPGEEDIGLTPVEAQASGRPVIAYGRGGALETVRGFFSGDAATPESSTGIFFAPQSVEALVEAIRVFESVESRFSPAFIRSQVERFHTPRFKAEMGAFIAEKLAETRSISREPAPDGDL